jgi:hypothetical protein
MGEPADIAYKRFPDPSGFLSRAEDVSCKNARKIQLAALRSLMHQEYTRG